MKCDKGYYSPRHADRAFGTHLSRPLACYPFFINTCSVMIRRQYSNRWPLAKVKVLVDSSSEGKISHQIWGAIRMNTKGRNSDKSLSSFDNRAPKSKCRSVSSSSLCLRFWARDCRERVRWGDSEELMVTGFKLVDCCLVHLGTNSTWPTRDC